MEIAGRERKGGDVPQALMRWLSRENDRRRRCFPVEYGVFFWRTNTQPWHRAVTLHKQAFPEDRHIRDTRRASPVLQCAEESHLPSPAVERPCLRCRGRL